MYKNGEQFPPNGNVVDGFQYFFKWMKTNKWFFRIRMFRFSSKTVFCKNAFPKILFYSLDSQWICIFFIKIKVKSTRKKNQGKLFSFSASRLRIYRCKSDRYFKKRTFHSHPLNLFLHISLMNHQTRNTNQWTDQVDKVCSCKCQDHYRKRSQGYTWQNIETNNFIDQNWFV